MTFIEITKLNWNEAIRYDVRGLFYLVSYQVMKNRIENKRVKQMMNRYGSHR